mgnify:CR=1 FL=1
MFGDESAPVTTLDEKESFELLKEHRFGRLAMSVAGLPEIVPINYVVDDERIIFLTSAGNKLLGLTINSEVAFEVDQIHEHQATSVIVKGVARRLENRAEIEFAESLPLYPWVDTEKFYYVEIVPNVITGRSFRLNDHVDD